MGSPNKDSSFLSLIIAKITGTVMKRKRLYCLFLFFLGDIMKENNFQGELIKELKDRFKGCIVLKNNSAYLQGIPDLLILFGKKWAMLECKKSAKEHHQPNQDYYVHILNKMSFARFIFPENKEEVLNDLERTFRSKR